VIILNASIEDSESIANLHKLGIPSGFLSQQSIFFLSELYSYLIKNELVFCAKDNGKVIGFVAGTLTTNGLYKKFLRKNITLLLTFILKNLFSLLFIKKATETLFAPKKTITDDCETELPELLSIVVDKNYNGQGIGQDLVSALEEKLIELDVREYKVIVGSKLDANNFYLRKGFIKQKEFKLHKDESSFIYTKKLTSLK
jgi:ribosomal protein S18 acetylase RimI-like enzyme